MIVAEVLRALFVDIHRISAHVFVVGVTAVLIIVVGVRVVIVVVVVVVIVVVVAVAVVIAAVIVATVPSRISVVRPTVINDCGTVPSTVPTAVSPAAAPAAHHGTDSDSGAEANNARGNHGARGVGVCRDYVRVAIDDRRVIFRDVDNLGICGLDDNHLWRLLYHRNLRRSF